MLQPWLVLNTVLALVLLVGVVRLQRAQRRYRREVQARLATMAVLLEQARRGDLAADNGLTPAEEQTLTALRRRLARREARLLRERQRADGRPAPRPITPYPPEDSTTP
jgi:low affinity Fe/Cu permease